MKRSFEDVSLAAVTALTGVGVLAIVVLLFTGATL
jgi:hypothetical protein